MSSKRGRKRNDNLPPNRARDVQRAFRARRAAHLQALEERVSELEEENNCLRQALNLPPANRPPLGKGPTGKDKPKPYENTHSRPPTLTWSRDSSSADSPASLQGDLDSPVIVSTIIPPRPNVVQDIENGTGAWGQTIVMTDEVPQYPLPPMSTTPSLPSKPITYSPPYASSRSSMYMYSNGGSERNLPSYLEQRSYSYSVQPHSHPSTPYEGREVIPSPPLLAGYPPRRSGTADFSLGGYPCSGGIRLPSPPRGLGEREGHLHPHHDLHTLRHPYTSDGRIVSG